MQRVDHTVQYTIPGIGIFVKVYIFLIRKLGGISMPVNSETRVDLNSREVREFLCSQDLTYQQPNDQDLMNRLGLEFRAERAFPFPPTLSAAYTMLKRRYHVMQDRTVLSVVTSLCPVEHSLEIRLKGVLLVATAATASNKQLMEDAFMVYDPRSNPDLQKYAQDIADANGISSSDYYILFPFHLTKVPPPTIDESQDGALRNWIARNENLRLALISEECIHINTGEPDLGDNIVVIGDINDTSEIDKRISDELDERERLSPCDQLKRMVERITQVFYYPEFKTETECHWESILCFQTRICIDVPYIRDCNVILYATLLYPDSATPFEIILKECLTTSAIAAVVVGVIMEDFIAAMAAFRALFIECLTEHTIELLECIDPNLILVEERSNWRRIF